VVTKVLKPWLEADLSVEVRSTKALSFEEEDKILQGIGIAFFQGFPCNTCPSFGSVKRALKQNDPGLVTKLISIQYC